MTLETAVYSLPAHWAPALFNDDRTGLDDAEERQLDAFVEAEGLLAPLDCSSESFFCVHHDARSSGVLACDCLEYTFPLRSGSSPDSDR